MTCRKHYEKRRRSVGMRREKRHKEKISYPNIIVYVNYKNQPPGAGFCLDKTKLKL